VPPRREERRPAVARATLVGMADAAEPQSSGTENPPAALPADRGVGGAPAAPSEEAAHLGGTDDHHHDDLVEPHHHDDLVEPHHHGGFHHHHLGHPHSPHIPAWARATAGEHRYQVTIAVLVAIALQVVTPKSLTINPTWLLPALEGLLLIGLVAVNPGRINKRSATLRNVMLLFMAAISFANASSLVLLTHGLVFGTEGNNAKALLAAGATIWGTNVIVFSLWYWEFDRGGPGARAEGGLRHPDLLFPQMSTPDLASEKWEPQFFDYLYTSFTNATAFSPTDTMPLSRWTKMLFLLQSAVSLVTAALIVGRAVNILK
jgi:uncharacterized membrane protein